MRPGIGTWAFPWPIGIPGHPQPSDPLDAVGLLRRARSLGLSLVQICDNLPYYDLSPPELAEIRQTADDLGSALGLGTRGVQPEHLRGILDYASDRPLAAHRGGHPRAAGVCATQTDNHRVTGTGQREQRRAALADPPRGHARRRALPLFLGMKDFRSLADFGSLDPVPPLSEKIQRKEQTECSDKNRQWLHRRNCLKA